MSNSTVTPLTYDDLRTAVSGSAAAIRLRVRLQPAGGADDKVFPPTYAGGIYASEKRLIGDELLPVVLLDSVQSQANRLEWGKRTGIIRGVRAVAPLKRHVLIERHAAMVG